MSLYEDKKNNKLLSINQELEKLLLERKRIDELIRNLKKNKLKIENNKYFNYNIGLELIRYIVSKIEGKDYLLKNYVYNYNYTFIGKETNNKSFSVRIDYLTTKEKEQESIDELKERCKTVDKIYYTHSINYKDNNLLIPSNNFIQLTSYRYMNEPDNIYFNNDNISTIDTSSPILNIDSKICDSKYFYIFDYVNKVIEYRLDNNDFDLDIEEIKKIIDSYINNVKLDK